MDKEYDYLVGYGRVDITPKESVPLAGYGSTLNRMSRIIRDRIYASCIAITDQSGETLLLTSTDLVGINQDVVTLAREVTEKFLGLPADRNMIAATHTHSSVDTHAAIPAIERYNDDLGARLLPAAAAIAMADRRPAKLYVGETDTDRLNFIRHYKVTPPDGEPFYLGDNHNSHGVPKDWIQNYAEHASPIYRRMHVVRFEREGAKDIVFINWRAHATLTGGQKRYFVSADFIGDTRGIIEEKTDCLFTYFQGAAGNVNPHSRIQKEERAKDCVAYSVLLSEAVLKGLKNLRYEKPGRIKTVRAAFEGRINHTKDHLAKEAEKIHKIFRETGDRDGCNEMAKELGLFSIYEAGAVARHAEMPQTMTIETNALSIGDLAFVTAPDELFDGFSVYIEGKSPFSKTLTLGYCNGKKGYIPSKRAYEYGCYEADTTNFAPGTLEDLEEHFLKMLAELKEQ